MWCSAVGCIVTLLLSLLVAPRATTAQPRGTIPRVAVLVSTAQERPTPCLFAFQQGLRDLGYVEGQTIGCVPPFTRDVIGREIGLVLGRKLRPLVQDHS